MQLTPPEQELANSILGRNYKDARALQETGVALTPVLSYACKFGPKSPLYKAVVDYMDHYGEKIELAAIKSEEKKKQKNKPRHVRH